MSFQFDVLSSHRMTSGVAVASGRVRLKGGIISPSASTTANTAFVANTPVTGTYDQSSTTITVTMANSLANGDRVWLDFTSGNAVDAMYTVSSVSATGFVVTGASTTTSGNVKMYATVLMGVDTRSATPFSFLVPGDGIVSADGLYVGLPSIIAATVFYG